ncbi:fe2+ zn2+ uptake regulation protein [Pseudomonas bubulae]|uniref:fe2+ zn2+ uptake regulation protein n=1 Tax=Pseudomonas bubulae TaxID=2316085 RepID=UPI003D07A4FF
MHNQQIPTDGRNPHREVDFQPDTGLLEAFAPLQGNERIRHLLKCFGLRTSLVRLKVIDALLTAAGNDRRLGVRGMHSHLQALDIPLSFLSVREVLKRLCSEGVVVLNSDKSYSLHPQAEAVLTGKIEA